SAGNTPNSHLINKVDVSVPAGTQNTGTSSATDDDTLTPQADLQVTKTTNDASVVGGQGAASNITYTITVKNVGTSSAFSPELHDTVPIGTTFVSFTQNTGTPWTKLSEPLPGETTPEIFYAVQELRPNDTATFTLVV